MRIVGDNEGDWFSQSIDEISNDVRDAQEEPMVRYTLAQIKIARLQARVAFDTAKSQERLVRNLVRGTWALVIATLIVAAVAIWASGDSPERREDGLNRSIPMLGSSPSERRQGRHAA